MATTLAIGSTLALKATGNYSDGTTKDLTDSATWTSSSEAVGTVSEGVVSPVSAGNTDITASIDSVVSPAFAVTVTV